MESTELFDTVIEALIKMLIVIVPIILSFLTRAIINFLKQKELQLHADGKSTELTILRTFSNLAVFAAEQIHEGNSTKLNFAITELIRISAGAGIPLSRLDAELLIEGSVKAVKNQLGPGQNYYISPPTVNIVSKEQDSGAPGDIIIFDPKINE